MAERLDVTKTYKLYINGKFPRTESGRSMPIEDTKGNIIAHLSRASRKDLRDAIEAASKAQSGWFDRTAYNRGQILYRMAEMLEGKREEFAETIKATTGRTVNQSRKEVDASIDRLVCFAGWADKYTHVLGANNTVAGPYYNFTAPEPTGVIGVLAPNEPPLLGLISLIAPALCAGNTVAVLASEAHPMSAAIFAEVCATSDVPPGVINLLTGNRNELIEHLANHRNVNGISAANVSKKQRETLELGIADNLKRVHVENYSDDDWFDVDPFESPWMIEPFVEFKTIWHPSAS